MNILSIQSAVAYGHVGNSAAVFALQRLGHEVWPLNTVELSNHPGHPTWRGRTTDPGHLQELVDGLDALGVLARCDAILTGYLGSAANGDTALAVVDRVHRRAGGALYCCDPVLGNERKGLFVAPDIAAFMRERAIPAADIATPNRFELGLLTGDVVTDAASAAAAADKLAAMGPQVVAVSGIRDGGRIGCLARSSIGAWRVDTPIVDGVADDGAGDLFCALFLGHYLRTGEVAPALERAAAATFAVFEETARLQSDELSLVAAQDRLRDPPRLFTASAFP